MTVADTVILTVGVLVTAAVLVGVVLIGLTEAADPDQARLEDLNEFERELVDRDGKP